MNRLIRAVVDTSALRANLQRLRAAAPGRRVMAVIKANAYGHGLVPTALALPQADAFGVARIDEAAALRDAGVTQPVVLLEGVLDAVQLQEAERLGLDQVVHDPAQLDLLERYATPGGAAFWLKIDTGMNRLGFRPEQFPEALQRLQGIAGRHRVLRLMTHLARADEPAEAMTAGQLERFAALTAGMPHERSIANSAAVLGTPASLGDWIRPGLALYGVSPFADRSAAELGLQPVMTLQSVVIAVRSVRRGETVGYGGAWCAARDSRIAIIAAGYGDGLPRAWPSGTPVLIDGQRRPLVGRVSMDMIAVDVTDSPHVPVPGTPVLLWGAGLSVEEMAHAAGSIPWELLCSISRRVELVLR
ncbi:MAG: alanine racemase [Pseudomonadota bacterium]